MKGTYGLILKVFLDAKIVYRKTPLLGQFSNANIFLFECLKVKYNTRLNRRQFEILKSVLFSFINWSHTKIFAFENGPTPGTKSGVFRFYNFTYGNYGFIDTLIGDSCGGILISKDKILTTAQLEFKKKVKLSVSNWLFSKQKIFSL